MPPGQQPALTWADLDPLFHDTWRDTEAVWALLHAQRIPIIRVCQKVFRLRCAGGHPRFADARELFQGVVEMTVRRLSESKGMKRPDDREGGSARAFFVRYLKSRAKDCLKPKGSDGETPASVKADNKGPSTTPEAQLEQLDYQRDPTRNAAAQPSVERIAVRRKLERLREAVDAPEQNARQRLAWICLRAPEWLALRHVTAAVEASASGVGVVRPETDLWVGLQRWFRTVVDPTGRPSRRHLAWLLFSTDNTTPESWTSREPNAARDARDRLRQWDGRFHKAVCRAVAAAQEDSP